MAQEDAAGSQQQQQQPPEGSGGGGVPFAVAAEVALKGTNLGTTIRCSVAFGAHRLFLVGGGRGGRVRVGTHGAFGSNHFLPQRTFFSWAELAGAAHGEGWSLVGVVPEGESDSSGRSNGNGDSTEASSSSSSAVASTASLPVETRPFRGPTVFVTAIKGKALSAAQRAACDAFVHVRVPNPRCRGAFVTGAAFLENDILLSIALHHFASWGRCKASSVRGQKYVLGRRTLTGAVDEEERLRLQEERARYKARADILGGQGEEEEEGRGEAGSGGGGLLGLWGGGDDDDDVDEDDDDDDDDDDGEGES